MAATQRKAAAQPSSRYVGVRWDQHRGRRWRAEIWHEGRTQHLGSFAEEEEEEAAARAFDEAARRLRGEKAHGGRNRAGSGTWRLNFPTEAEAAAVPNEPDDAPEPADDEQVAAAEAVVAQRRAAGQPTSSFAGVSWAKKGRRWRAEIKHEGRVQGLGTFAEEQAAARAFDDAARRLRGGEAHGGRSGTGRGAVAWKLNFPTEAEAAAAPDYADEEAMAAAGAAVAQRSAAGQPSSRYVGVSWIVSTRRWQAYLPTSIDGKQRSLGTFGTEAAAALAVFKAQGRHGIGDAEALARQERPATRTPRGEAQVRAAVRRLVSAVEAADHKAQRTTEAQVRSAVRRLVRGVRAADAAATDAAVAQRRAAGEPASRHVGVSWVKSARRWLAQISIGSCKQRALGTFDTEAAAALAVERAKTKQRA
eukprot:COSAG04_NODE_688_length_11148_cov_2.882071_8_plen_420_part_00